jgi:isochorismate synthase EntC
VIGLRSAILAATSATVWAGAGIVAASNPEAELAETSVKLAPVLEGLATGASALLEGYALKY